MNDFFQGIIACIAMLGGICGFNYWMFLMMEKRIDTKLDIVVRDVHALAIEVTRQGQRSDHLYEVFTQKMDKQSEIFTQKMDKQTQRTDQLYEICIDLLKDKKATKEKK